MSKFYRCCLFVSLVSGTVSHGFAQVIPYRIKGQLIHSNANSRGKVYLLYGTTGGYQVDSSSLIAESYLFKGSVAGPVNATILYDHTGLGLGSLQGNRSPDACDFYLESHQISLEGKDSVKYSVVSGGHYNVEYSMLKAKLKLNTDQVARLLASAYSASQEQRQDLNFQTSIKNKYTALIKDKQGIITSFIKEHPLSKVAFDSFVQTFNPELDAETAEKTFKIFNGTIRNSYEGLAWKAKVDFLKRTAIGAIAPDFILPDTLGHKVKLSSLRGKYLLVDFWASWCKPCRMENPNVVAAFKRFHTKNFAVLGISLDQQDGKESWLRAIHEDNLTWTQLSDLQFWNNEAAVLYGIRSIPANILLDPEGKIVARNLRGQELEDSLSGYLSK